MISLSLTPLQYILNNSGKEICYAGVVSQTGTNFENNEDAVLVTVVASSGSTPRGAGARMLVTKDGGCTGQLAAGSGIQKRKMARSATEKLAHRAFSPVPQRGRGFGHDLRR